MKKLWMMNCLSFYVVFFVLFCFVFHIMIIMVVVVIEFFKIQFFLPRKNNENKKNMKQTDSVKRKTPTYHI